VEEEGFGGRGTWEREAGVMISGECEEDGFGCMCNGWPTSSYIQGGLEVELLVASEGGRHEISCQQDQQERGS
jgi:hypothetical protein